MSSAEQKTLPTILETLQRHKVTMQATRLTVARAGWERDTDATHWTCTFDVGGRKVNGVAFEYSMGSACSYPGVKGEQLKKFRWGQSAIPPKPALPKMEDVVNCLLCDTDSIDQSFEDWCSDYGYDSDSRKAHATYEACQQALYKCRKVFGHALFDELRACERL